MIYQILTGPMDLVMDFPQLVELKAQHPEANTLIYTVALPFDHETIVSLADRFADRDHVILLESATAGPNARYSLLGFDPIWTFKADQGKNTFYTAGGKPQEILAENPVTGLRQVMQRHRMAAVYPKGTRLGGPDIAQMAGCFGFFSYDAARFIEPTVGTPPPKKLGVPDTLFFLPKFFLVMDHLSRRLFVSRLVSFDSDLTVEDTKRQATVDAALKDLTDLLARLQTLHAPAPLKISEGGPDYEACEASFDYPTFKACGERCLEEIRAGEIFQIQIGNRLTSPCAARPFDVFRHLRTLNPSPYMFYFKYNEQHILGASPEMMVGVQGKQLTHRPIAGTRKRNWDPAYDRRMRQELISSEKERAEHVMLVDLSRNDIGRIAAPGTVQVEELMMVEEYSHVFHMVSQVSGVLKDDLDAYDAMVASFPNGTVSGAPKIRAMQLIYGMEKVSREFYAGSLGLFDFTGNLKSTILIRTIHVANGKASTQASAGFVYDSIPEQEWQETRNKMAACLIAMQHTL